MERQQGHEHHQRQQGAEEGMGRNQTQAKSGRSQGLAIQKSSSGSADLLRLLVRNLSLMLGGGIMLLGMVILIGMGRTGGQFLQQMRSLFTVAIPPAKVDVRSVVIQQIRGASELTTAIYSMESVVPASRERTIGGYTIGKTTLLYIAHGEVRAGVDLTVLQPQDVQVLGDTMSLRLPPPKILDSKIDVNRSQVYDYDRGFLGLGPDVAPELQEMAQRETLAKIVETACTDGVLQSANERAKLAVSQLLTTAGYSQFTIETQAADLQTCIASQPVTSLPSVAPMPSVAPALSPSSVPSSVPSPMPTIVPSPVPSPTPIAPIDPTLVSPPAGL